MLKNFHLQIFTALSWKGKHIVNSHVKRVEILKILLLSKNLTFKNIT